MARRALIVVAIVVAAGSPLIVRQFFVPRSRLERVICSLDSRPYSSRLSNIPYVPRSVRSVTTLSIGRFRSAATEVLASDEPASMKAFAAVLVGNPSGAVRVLQRSVAAFPTDATAWSDLSAAHTANAEQLRDAGELCAALAAADRALDLAPSLPEALFNRAASLEALSLRAAAAAAFDEYLTVDGTSQWAVEARQRSQLLRREATELELWRKSVAELERVGQTVDPAVVREAVVRFPQQIRTFGERIFLTRWGAAVLRNDPAETAAMLTLARTIGQTLETTRGESYLADAVRSIDYAARTDPERLAQIAEGHVAYGEARVLYRNRAIAKAAKRFEEAQRLFDSGGSSMAAIASYYRAAAASDAGDAGGAASLLRPLLSQTPERYRSLRAELRWLEGTISGRNGLLEHALRCYRDAQDAFTRAGETENATEMRSRVAALLTMLGRAEEAWRLRIDSFAAADASGDPARLQNALYSAASDALREQHWNVAHSLLSLAAGIEGGSPSVFAEASIWRAAAGKRAGFVRTTALELAAARRAADALADRGLREEVTNDARLAEAFVVREDNPARAIALLTDYIDGSTARLSTTARVADVLLERARLLRQSNHPAEAEADYRRAIEVIELRRESIGSRGLRDSFLGKFGDAYVELADLLDARGAIDDALRVLERRRRGPDSAAKEAFPAPAALLADTAILTYGVYDDRVVAYVLSRTGTDRFVTSLRRDALRSLVTSFAAAIQHHETNSFRTVGRRLCQTLIPAAVAGAKSLVIVADEALENVPFPALIEEDDRYLIEHHIIAIAPRIATTNRRTSTGVSDRAVVVGNPELDSSREAALAPLRGAEAEAQRIAALYGTTALTGPEATETVIRRALERSDVAHFAVHGVLDERNTRRSHLVLANDAENDGALTVDEILSMNLDRLRMVVLASCRTASAGAGYGNVRSLAAAFLAAGADSVTASLWDLDDEITSPIAVRLHEELDAGSTPAEALRAVQLWAMRSPDARLQAPRAWAGLQLFAAR
jgi:CHAT domain-containing protein